MATVVLHLDCNRLDYGCGDYGFALRLQYAGLRLWRLWFCIKTVPLWFCIKTAIGWITVVVTMVLH